MGQLVVGHLGDVFGRKRVYGMALMIMIIGAFCQSMSFGSTPDAVIGTLCFWRFLLGVGIGGDYPLSATIMSEYSSASNRGAYVGAVFAMQGVGILVAAAVTAIVAASFKAAYKSADFPLSVPGCASWSIEDTATGAPCPLENQQAYYDQVLASTPPEMDFVWRTVLAFGAFPAALTMYFRNQLAETPRYVVKVEHDAEQAEQDANNQIGDLAVVSTTLNQHRSGHADIEQQEQTTKPSESTVVESTSSSESSHHHHHRPAVPSMSFWQFVRKHKYELIGCSMSWFLLDIAFYSQNLFQKDVFLQTGWLVPAKHLNGIDETAKISYAQAVIALGSTIPGYWFTVFFVDRFGRKPIQIMGFLCMTAFMAALAGSYDHLLDPNNDSNTALSDDQPNARNGWVAMYALCFFFANFGPNSTTFIVPSELFPTSWRSTAHGFAAAMGKLGAIIGAFGFLFASQPAPGETTYSYPCYSSFGDLDINGACKQKNNCPSGRMTPAGAGLGDTCSECIPGVLSGCYPFGIGVQGALGILAATNFIGLLFTFFIPETAGERLEVLNGEDHDIDNSTKGDPSSKDAAEQKQNEHEHEYEAIVPVDNK